MILISSVTKPPVCWLKILLLIRRSIRKIYGYLEVEANAEGFTNLSFLENLEVILGQGLTRVPSRGSHPLWVYGTSLKFLGLTKLTKIEEGTVLIFDNKDLCFADQMDWNRVSDIMDN